jgi:hypothetical protein
MNEPSSPSLYDLNTPCHLSNLILTSQYVQTNRIYPTLAFRSFHPFNNYATYAIHQTDLRIYY